jgi:carboxypeptidase Taq
MAELADLSNAAHLLHWDQQTMMPPAGRESRAEASATLRRVLHERLTAPETGEAIEAAQAALDGVAEDSDEARLVAVARRRFEKASRVPGELTAELARAASLGHEAWVRARAASDFSLFAPYLERNVELALQYVDCFDGYACRYDVLLDDHEPGMESVQVARLFGELKAELVPLIATLAEHADRVDDAVLHGRFPVAGQRLLVERTVALMGFDRVSWRLDEAVHPFATALGANDVRITTRWDETYFPAALFGAMHECGHGLYEAGIAPELQRSPLGQTDSLGLHESQSRLWENMVGRGRPFAEWLAPSVRETLGVAAEPERLYRAVNKVSPSFIRVEADEATYGLHIILRFELERALIDRELSVADLPAAWNERFQASFGLRVPDDAHGVLQDVHWALGLIGYFPTYALGNLIAGELWARARAELPELERRIAAGDVTLLREWLRERVHRHGAKFTAGELLRRAFGRPITVQPFVSYLKAKLGDVYGVQL